MKALTTLAVLASLSLPSLALAGDSVGSRGTLTTLEVNTPSADTYLQYFGRAVVLTSSGKNNTSSVEYRWGGTSCGSRVLSDAEVAMLQRALESGTPIAPRYQAGQGSTLCLVGFTLAP